jgi:hypothetical protein
MPSSFDVLVQEAFSSKDRCAARLVKLIVKGRANKSPQGIAS